MNSEKNNSFSSANADLPVKLLRHRDFTSMLQRGYVAPIHLQWIPTNRCNANCSFCSCAGRDKALELDFDRSKNAIELFASLGTRAATITGGGEPTLYPHFDSLIDVFIKNGIEVGLVTNGLNASCWNIETIKKLRWVRISISDEYILEHIEDILDNHKRKIMGVDLALSYVVTPAPDNGKMRKALEIANKYELTHIRFVHDIVRGNELMPDYETIFSGMDRSRAIIQPRAAHESGSPTCGTSLAKPVIYTDGNIYPCCGAQYATTEAESKSDMPKGFSMGTIEDAESIWKHQWAFDGSLCSKCYYGGHNRVIGASTNFVKHINFI